MVSICSDSLAQEPPEVSVKTLRPADGLEVALWAREPMVVNPTAMDIDSRGRVWVAEGQNYRMDLKKFGPLKRIQGADRIKILSDTNADGTADQVVEFASDIFPVPMGLAVEEIWHDGIYRGARVYVGNSPDLLVLEDTDGDDRADRRYPLLSGFRGIDTDHGVHGMMLGPDGKLYFTVGDARYGMDNVGAHAPTFDVTDNSGRRLSASRSGTILSVNIDGTNLQVLAYGHRNNYETFVDSFGNIFASDNDDDGNQGCRTTWILEGGNYGYKHARSRRHWAEELPGVIPKIVGTGNGSPCGLLVYEGGGVLPAEFKYSVLQVDAGTHQVNAHPLTRHGAGFRTDYKVILTGDDSWFRPVDVSIAPDGSLYVCDWYDAGVGGHRFSDQSTGRIYRLTRTDHPSNARPPVADFGTVEGSIAALQSPNVATRFTARNRLIADGLKARRALQELAQSGEPNARARALYVLADLPGGVQDVVRALRDSDPRIRETAVRILGQDTARESVVGPESARLTEPPALKRFRALESMANDPDAGVRRALLLTMRNVSTDQAGDLLMQLAMSWDGRDRYYLEALRAALVARDATFLQSLLDAMCDRAIRQGWDKTAVAMPPYFPTLTTDAFLRTSDALPGSNGASMVLGLAWSLQRGETIPSIRRILEQNRSPYVDQVADLALSQMDDLSAGTLMIDRLAASFTDPKRARLLLRHVAAGIAGPWKQLRDREELRDAIMGAIRNPELRPDAIKAIAKTRLTGFSADLADVAKNPSVPIDDRAFAIEALGELNDRPSRIMAKQWLNQSRGKDRGDPLTLASLSAIRKIEGDAADRQLFEVVTDDAYPLDVRRRALQLLVTGMKGAEALMSMHQKGVFPQELMSEFAFQTHNHSDQRIRHMAARQLPVAKADVPDVQAILAIGGKPGPGRELFFTNKDAACARCHRVNGQGDMIGPDLSSIGTKYGKRELFYHIVNPSGAINYNYVSHTVLLDDGRVLVGLVIDRSGNSMTLRTANGETVQIDDDSIEEQRANSVSLMPEGLATKLNAQQLADLLQYVSTLRQSPK